MTTNDVMALWPSIAELARDIGEPYETVRKWKVRGSIPAAYWVAITTAAAKRGFDVTLEALARIQHEARAA